MRHKQMPTKSSRHKSLTFIIGSQTSFTCSNNNGGTNSSNNNIQRQQHDLHHSTLPTMKPSSSSLLQREVQLQQQQQQLQKQQQHSHQHKDNYNNHYSLQQQPKHHSPIPSPPIQSPHQIHNHHHNHQQQQQQQQQPPMRKQFEHNYRHMSGVMRLAFLENNDISIDDCINVDFNSLSTASILQRNIQQQLQRERRDQLQFNQQQQHLHYQQDFGRHDIKHEHLDHYDQDDIDDNITNEFDHKLGNYEISDNLIFATASPSSASSRSVLNSAPPRALSVPRINDIQPQNIKSGSDGFFCDEPDCGKSFPSLRKLRHHKVVHSDEFPYICEFQGCSKKFKRKFGIDLHSTTHFDLDPDMYAKTSNNSSLSFFGRRMQYSMCKPCNQKFKTVHEYQYHMLKHGKEPFKCPVKGCGQTFSIWKSFQKHRASHYFNYYCKVDPGCDHHTSNLQLLKLHIYCCHFKRRLPENATLSSKDVAEVPDVSMDDDNDNVNDNEPEPDHDHENGLDDSAEMNMVDHMLEQESIESEDPLEIIETPPKRSIPDIPTTPRRDSRLRKNPPKSSTWQQQEILFSKDSMYSDDVPVRSIKSDSEGFYCDEPDCGKSFPSLRKLRHHKVVHSDEFPFVCEFKGCSKKFKRKFGIDLHSTTHFDLDPDMYAKTSNNSSLPFFGRRMQYSMCKPCGQKFKTVHEYQYHMLKHGKEPFKCPVKGCGQTFSIWKSFQKHRASHYFNYYCKVDPGCDHHTSNLQLLKLHIYCCHFKRRLPENATLSSKDVAEVPDVSMEDESGRDDSTAMNLDDQSLDQGSLESEDPLEVIETPPKPSIPETPVTPRRDSRLRKNPPRSSAFGHQDSLTIGKGFL